MAAGTVKRIDEHEYIIQEDGAAVRLAGRIAHDFNNILAVIISYARFAQVNAGQNPALASDLNEILEAADRGKELVRALQHFSRGGLALPQIVDLNQMLGEQLENLKEIVGKSIKVVFAPDKDVGLVKVDPDSLQRVLTHLAANAREAIEAKGTTNEDHVLTLMTQRCEDDFGNPRARIQMRDTGTGVPLEVRDEIFELFFTTKSQRQGKGLGLPICCGLIREADGSISVESEVGRGTVIHITLPVTLPADREALPTDMDEEGRQGQRVLLVDDNQALRLAAKRTLEANGYIVRDAANGEAALAELEHPPDVDFAVVDLQMPVMGGEELMKHLRSKRPNLPVLFTTGFVPTEEAQALSQPRTEMLLKPFSGEELLRAVGGLLDSGSPA